MDGNRTGEQLENHDQERPQEAPNSSGLSFENLRQAQGSVVKLHTAYQGRGDTRHYMEDYARVGVSDTFPDQDKDGKNGVQMHMEVKPPDSHGIRIITKGQIKRGEVIVTATKPHEIDGRNFAYEPQTGNNPASISRKVREGFEIALLFNIGTPAGRELLDGTRIQLESQGKDFNVDDHEGFVRIWTRPTGTSTFE